MVPGASSVTTSFSPLNPQQPTCAAMGNKLRFGPGQAAKATALLANSGPISHAHPQVLVYHHPIEHTHTRTRATWPTTRTKNTGGNPVRLINKPFICCSVARCIASTHCRVASNLTPQEISP